MIDVSVKWAYKVLLDIMNKAHFSLVRY